MLPFKAWMLYLFCQSVFNSSCSRVPAVSCIFFKRTWLGHACKSVPDMSSVRHRYNTSNEVFVLPTFIYIFEGVWYIFPLIKSPVPLPVPLIITSSNTPRRISMIMFCCSFSFTFFFPLQPIFLLTLVSTF